MKKHLIFSIVTLMVLSFKIGEIAYLETSEARYAQISSEMAESGSYLIPTLNHVKHLHKPPLTYWITAFAFNTFGKNNTSGRVFLILAAWGTVLITGRMARLLFPQDKAAEMTAMMILMGSLLFLIQSRVLTTDIYQTFFITLTHFFLTAYFFSKPKISVLLAAGCSLGMGVMTKGHVPLMFTVLPWMLFLTAGHRWRDLNPIHFLISLLGFFVTTLPWFILMIAEIPGLLDYFLVFQGVQRLTSSVHHRSGPFYYYIVIAAAGLWMWFPAYFSGLIQRLKEWRTISADLPDLLLGFSILLPFLVLSASGSKLPSYILPLFPISALQLTYWKSKDRISLKRISRWGETGILALTVIILALLIFIRSDQIPDSFPHTHPVLILFSAGCLGLLAIRFLNPGIRPERQTWVNSAVNIGLFLTAVSLVPAVQEDLNSFQPMSNVINRSKTKDARLVTFRERLPSLTFYTGLPVIQTEHDRELQFEPAEDSLRLRYFYRDSGTEIGTLFNEDTLTYLVCRRRHWRKYHTDWGVDGAGLEPLYQNMNYILLANSGRRR